MRSKLQLCQLEIPIFVYKLMCLRSLIKSVSFVFCEFNRIARWNEGKTIIFVRSSFKFPNRNTGFIFKVNVCHVNMSFHSGNFEGNFSTYVFGKSFWHFRELKIDCWTSRNILCEKILNSSCVCVEVRILVEKRNVYEGHIFPRPLLQTCR